MEKLLTAPHFLKATLLAVCALSSLDGAIIWASSRNSELRGSHATVSAITPLKQITISTDRGSLTVQIGTNVTITDQYLGDMGLRNLLQYLTKDLTSLTIRNAGITKEGISALLEWDSNHHIRNLATLDLGCNNIGLEGILLLTRRLRLHFANITTLNLEHNNIGDDVTDMLIHDSMMPRNLKTINLRGNPLSPTSLGQLIGRFSGVNGRPLLMHESLPL
ncbi:MAG: hypothetical protein NTX76_02675 [Alphaproteobacteria bacterium]|nr:hypothetical protein [Alphaproteobacteria bacterium]